MKLLFAFFILSYSYAKIVDLKQYQSSVKNQGDRNTCAYFAVTALMESAIGQKFGQSVDLSEQYQIHNGKTHFNEYSDKEFGSTYDILLNFKHQRGSYLEESIPYQSSFFEPGRPCADEDPYDTSTPPSCFSQDPLIKMSERRVSWADLNTESINGLFSYWLTRSENIMKHMDEGRAVAITFKVYAPLWDTSHVTYTKEIDQKCESGELACYGHAVLLTGYDSEKEVFFFKNSWGESWGESGYGTVSFDYVDNYSDQPLTVWFGRYSYFKFRD